MSVADVRFYTMNNEPCGPDDKPVRFAFRCPKSLGRNSYCGNLLIAGASDIRRDPQGKNGGRPQWSWDGDRVAPTFTPSVDCGGCWHGYIEKGRCVDTSKKDEP